MSVSKDSYGEDIFPFGAMYAPVARATEVPVSEWESDIARMKELGFTIIRSWAAWDRIERVEGQRDFEKLDYVFQLAEKNELKITLFIGGAFSSLMGCYPPVWLRNRCQRQTEVSRERDAELSLCFDDPLYREKAEDFLRELIDRYASHPALHSWIVWGEPAWNGCRCPKTVAAYRKWLQGRYDTLALLNEAWSSEAPHDYDRWEDVQPVSCGYAPSIDWHRFCEDHLNEVIGCVTDL